VNAIVERERLIMGQIPDAIIGDLDSLDENVEAFYQGNGVAIVRDPDQYSTDFTKCLKWLRQTAGSTQGLGSRLDIVALGGLGGRVDQGFSQIHHLYMATRNTELLVGEIYLLSEQSLSFVLEEGCNRIELSRKIFAENVGIIPITGPAVITTRGLEWDVQNWKTEFGGKISTSNHLKSETIEIETTTRVLFTVELLEDLTVKVTTAA
jgi:thiamine pyrophosphokinase